MKLSIVTSLYNSELYLNEFCKRVTEAAYKLVQDDYEIILVNDGSPDNCLNLAQKIIQNNPRIVLIDLSRNFGHHKAMMTGLAHINGDLIYLIDCDLEEEPEWILKFYEQMQIKKTDVVYGIQERRKGKIFERITGAIYYKLFRTLTSIDQPDNIVTARLMTKRYVEALLKHQERELNIGGLWITTGFDQSKFTVVKHSSSPTTYTLSKKMAHLVNAITSFSSLPLIFSFYIGIMISIGALIYIGFLLYSYFFISSPPSGYISIIASIWFFSGLIIFCIGVQGIYIAKIFTEVKQRPLTIIRKIYKNIN